MPDDRNATTPAIPPDDPTRDAVDRNAEDDEVQHLAVVGDTDTILLGGETPAGPTP